MTFVRTVWLGSMVAAAASASEIYPSLAIACSTSFWRA